MEKGKNRDLGNVKCIIGENQRVLVIDNWGLDKRKVNNYFYLFNENQRQHLTLKLNNSVQDRN